MWKLTWGIGSQERMPMWCNWREHCRYLGYRRLYRHATSDGWRRSSWMRPEIRWNRNYFCNRVRLHLFWHLFVAPANPVSVLSPPFVQTGWIHRSLQTWATLTPRLKVNGVAIRIGRSHLTGNRWVPLASPLTVKASSKNRSVHVSVLDYLFVRYEAMANCLKARIILTL